MDTSSVRERIVRSARRNKNRMTPDKSLEGDVKDSFYKLRLHTPCNQRCLITNPDMSEMKRMVTEKKIPFLSLPILLGWRRWKTTDSSNTSLAKIVVYKSPCHKSFKTLNEIHKYLLSTGCHLPINFFSFSENINMDVFLPKFGPTILQDLSRGSEFLPISVVNVVDAFTFNSLANKYISKCTFDADVKKNDDSGFMVCCDCVDDCKDKKKCSCFQLTLKNCDPKTRATYETDEIGYEYKLLGFPLLSGIYECNRMCRCSSTCFNRTIQQDIMFELQLFKTSKKGWGVRTLDDIPEGSFICNYAGLIITSQKGSGFKSERWKYLADLTVALPFKDGYEEEITEPIAEPIRPSPTIVRLVKKGKSAFKPEKTNVRSRIKSKHPASSSTSSKKSSQLPIAVYPLGWGLNKRIPIKKENDNSNLPIAVYPLGLNKENNQSSQPPIAIYSSRVRSRVPTNEERVCLKNKRPIGPLKRLFPMLNVKVPVKVVTTDVSGIRKLKYNRKLREIIFQAQTSKSPTNFESLIRKYIIKNRVARLPKRVGNSKYKLRLKNVAQKQKKNEMPCPEQKHQNPDLKIGKFVVDAQNEGNIGRYFNHSCEPNLFSQYVFTESQDINLPNISLFAITDIKAGTELTWNYNYDYEGANKKKAIACYCGSKNCKGRLY